MNGSLTNWKILPSPSEKKPTFNLYRIMNKTIRIIQFFLENRSASLRIGNLSEEVTKPVLQQTLSAFGKVDDVFYNRKGVAIIIFSKWCDASNARSYLNGSLLKGYEMVVTWADPDEEFDSDTGKSKCVVTM